MRLNELVAHYDPSLVAHILRQQGWPAEEGSGAEEQTLARLSDRDRLAALWTGLPAEGRWLVEGLQQAGGSMPALVLSILYEATAEDTPAIPFEELAVHLAALGLIYWHRGGLRVRSLRPQGEAVLPDEVAAALPVLPSLPPDRVYPASPQRLARDLGRMARFLRRSSGIALTRDGRLPARWVRALQRWLGLAGSPRDLAYITFLRRLLERMGVLRTHGATLILETLHPFWEQEATDRAAAAFHAWKGAGISEGEEGEHLSPELLRARLEQGLRGHEAGAWIPLPALVAAALREPAARAPDPLSPAGQERAARWKAWLMEETLWPLHWLGVLDRGDRGGRWTMARLTAFGAWMLGVGEPVALPEEGGRLVVQPDFRILAFEPISEAVRTALEAFTEPTPGEPISIYQITREALYRGLSQGWDIPRVIRFLEGISGEPLPSNVRRSLEDWHRRFNRVRIYRRVTLVRSGEDGLPADPSLRPLGEGLGWTGERAEALAARWRARGIRPWMSGFRSEDLRNQVVAEDSGILRWTGPFPHPGVERLLEPFTERTPEGFRITEASLQAGREAGLSLSEILQRLQQVHRGPLPAGLLARLLTWSEHPPRARWEPVILLRMDRPEILEALCREPALSPWVRPLDAHTLMVRADHASALKAWLEAMGITVEEVR